ncbi:MAG: CBS domain-containing protein [candidate division Zixibacteria bacterium]|nr:CBS domain-containing protein [candidate division Zixibacteria bacterium]
MIVKKAGDIMIPLCKYPIIDSSATVLDAILKLNKSRCNSESGKQPYQAVLVADKNKRIIGKIGQFAILKSLEPQSRVSDDHDALQRAGVSNELIETAFDHIRNLHQGLPEMCPGASALPVRSAMTPFKEHVDKDTPIREVVHKILEWQTLSILVTDDDYPVGLVRLSDLCDEVMRQMQQVSKSVDDEG